MGYRAIKLSSQEKPIEIVKLNLSGAANQEDEDSLGKLSEIMEGKKAVTYITLYLQHQSDIYKDSEKNFKYPNDHPAILAAKRILRKMTKDDWDVTVLRVCGKCRIFGSNTNDDF